MIGIFDSGVGGMSVMREIIKALPHEDVMYVADSAHCPYGRKSAETIRRLSERIAAFLRERGCNVIVAACNTATAAAIDYLRAAMPDTPFVGIEPAVKPAAALSARKRIVVLATRGTIRGRKFLRTQRRHTQGIYVKKIVGRGLVELVEQGKENGSEAEIILRRLLKPAIAHGFDTIVLGCTHYPFLKDAIQRIAGSSVRLIDAALPVAMQTKRIVERISLPQDSNRDPTYIFYTTGNPDALKAMQERHLQLTNVSYHTLQKNLQNVNADFS